MPSNVPETPFRVVIIGIGAIAELIATALAQIPRAKLVAGSCRTAEKGRKFAERFGCQWFDDTEKMLDESRPDVAVICTPSGAHLEAAELCAARKIHIICEKPLEITAERARRLIDAADRAGIRLGAIFPQRFNPVNVAIHTAAEQGRFGNLAVVQGIVPWWREDAYYAPNRWQGKLSLDGGGALMNQAIHTVDLMQWIGGAGEPPSRQGTKTDTKTELTDEKVGGQNSEFRIQNSEFLRASLRDFAASWLPNPVEEVFACTAQRGHDSHLIEVEDTAVVTMKFRNGALGQLLAATSMWPGTKRRILIGGRDGSAEAFEDQLVQFQFRDERPEDESIRQSLSAVTNHGGGAGEPMAISGLNHRANLTDFFDALADGRPPALTGVEAAKAVQIIDACYQSARTGQAVRVV